MHFIINHRFGGGRAAGGQKKESGRWIHSELFVVKEFLLFGLVYFFYFQLSSHVNTHWLGILPFTSKFADVWLCTFLLEM